MVRTGRPRNTPGRVWGEIGVSACVLLVPLILIGAGVYGMLPVHGDGAARNSPPAAVESQPADFDSRAAWDTMRGADEPPSAVAALVSPMTTAAIAAAKPAMSAATKPAAAAKPNVSAAATKPATAAKPDAPPAKLAAGPPKAAAPEPTTFALASDRSELVGKDVPRALGPVPVQVTVVVAPNVEGEGGQPVSLGAAAPSPTAALPSAPAASPGAVEPARSTEAPREHRSGAWHTVRSHLRHVARRSEARAEAAPAHPAVEPPHAFSLRSLFPQQQQGGRQKSAVRG